MTRHALAIRDALRRRAEVSDAELDQVFPEELRERSHLHWTPVAIALRAAALLVPEPARSGVRVLDVGAGVGKMCLVGAVVTGSETLCAEEIESAEVELETTGPPKVTEPVLAVSDRAPLATTELVGAAKVVVTPER